MSDQQKEKIKEAVIEVLKSCYDPEIPVDIWEMGLIYDIDIDNQENVTIKMTLTSPACPVAGSLPAEVEQKVRDLEVVNDAKIELVWDPPWTPEKMSDLAKLELGFF